VAPDGHRIGAITTALVQGGGERGTRAIDSSAAAVLRAHEAASEAVPDGTDLVVWPEDVIDVEGDVRATEEGDRLSALAIELDTTVVAGVVTSVGDRFTNVAQVWRPDGSFGPTYEKNHRVPFGEYIPFRSLVERVADVSAVPRDARVGHGPGLLRTRPGRLGVVISYEVFFARRARAAIRAGGEVLLVPTNASSYSTTQMPALELAAARMRAVETGRWVLQAAPTGFTAVISAGGDVRQHTDLGRRDVLTAEVPRRAGLTLYTRLGDAPVLLLSLATLVAAWSLTRFRPGHSRHWLRPGTRRT
jgi:apolipoprotein N-acyltransferase